jgi:serine/threonine protein kinase
LKRKENGKINVSHTFMSESTKLIEPVNRQLPRRGGDLARRVVEPQRRDTFFPERTSNSDDEVIAQLEEQLSKEPTESSFSEEPIVEDTAESVDEKYNPKHAGGRKHRRPSPLSLVLRNGLHIARATQDRLLGKHKHVKPFRHEPFTPIQASGEPLPKREPVIIPKSSDTLIGNTTNTQTVVGSRIGGGSNADIYQTSDNLAVKIFKSPENSGTSGGGATPEQEAAMQASIDHPHVAVVHGVDSQGERYIPYMGMELVLGENLKERIKREPIPLEEGLLILTQTAQALLAIHDAGFVHRDFKPQNILLGDTGVKVTDFGIATQQGASVITPEGDILGSPKYTAPERLIPKNDDQKFFPEIPQSDMYSWGIVAYEVLTGQLPYVIDESDPYGTAKAHLYQEPRPFSEVLEDKMTALHGELEYIVARALAKNPAERYADFSVLVDNLEAVRRRAAKEESAGDMGLNENRGQQAVSDTEEETIKLPHESEKQHKQSWGDLVRGLRNRFRRQSSPDESLVSLDELLSSTDTTKREHGL